MSLRSSVLGVSAGTRIVSLGVFGTDAEATGTDVVGTGTVGSVEVLVISGTVSGTTGEAAIAAAGTTTGSAVVVEGFSDAASSGTLFSVLSTLGAAGDFVVGAFSAVGLIASGETGLVTVDVDSVDDVDRVFVGLLFLRGVCFDLGVTTFGDTFDGGDDPVGTTIFSGNAATGVLTVFDDVTVVAVFDTEFIGVCSGDFGKSGCFASDSMGFFSVVDKTAGTAGGAGGGVVTAGVISGGFTMLVTGDPETLGRLGFASNVLLEDCRAGGGGAVALEGGDTTGDGGLGLAIGCVASFAELI